MIRNLGKEKSIMNRFLAELRDEVIQKDPMRFRRNLERMGEVFAFEISKELAYGLQEVVTSLGVAEMELPLEEPVIATILRAGIPFHQGFLNYFDRAPSAFISCYRKHTTGNNFEIQLEYTSCPDLTGKSVILVDPMLASGSSLYLTYRELKQFGSPKHIHIVSVISSMEGINYLRRNLPLNDVTIWTAAIDEELTARSYIVPGLGDAGDLAYGKKTTAE
ncbi:MAG: uracil phosphoribosyltransferase [Bacteroidetes bacterium]|nr:MAG: uracil phosphoribosyltransferase [Bacteroidota bacterium]